MQILKVDVTSGTIKRWGVADSSPSEPIFVPQPDAKSEDDGRYISYICMLTKVYNY